jgi:signal transduction histidine kinase
VFKKSANSETVPMLTYWTSRYVLVLLISLFALAVVSGIWIRFNAYEHIYNLLEMRAEQLAGMYDRDKEEVVFPEMMQQETNRYRFASSFSEVVQIADSSGKIQNFKKEKQIDEVSTLYELSTSHQEVLSGKTIHEKVEVYSQTWLRVGVPVFRDGAVSKALYVSLPAKNLLLQISRLYGALALVTGTILITGWLVLYFLSRRLTNPLRQVAAAAQDIAGGKYDPVLPEQVKERELQQLIVSFGDMAQQLKQLEQLRTDLLAGVSHELRTPITSIRGMIQAVQSKVVTGREAEEFLEISLNEAKRLQQMVEELLDFSSFEAGAAPIRQDTVDLSRLVAEVVRQLSLSPEFLNLQLAANLPTEPVWVEGDAGRLRQIIINLFNNSQRASAAEIKTDLSTEADQVVLDVWDNGRGIALKDQPYVFERFYRGLPAKKKGLGLGLTISRMLARAHGGDLTLLSTGADGTIFRLCLPRSIAGKET